MFGNKLGSQKLRRPGPLHKSRNALRGEGGSICVTKCHRGRRGLTMLDNRYKNTLNQNFKVEVLKTILGKLFLHKFDYVDPLCMCVCVGGSQVSNIICTGGSSCCYQMLRRGGRGSTNWQNGVT
jgi:hypothetical protein